ncbi:MAG: SMI1/KNR4 family protein [Candidatus Lokiarchaeota archaeon]|nr:SMI1/KNR4 family protein [Candidatus Lokiarchaeota archaeon]
MPTTEPETSVPNDPARFFAWLKRESEARWKDAVLRDDVYGFQVQPGTRWNDGLSDDEIARFEEDMGLAFPPVYKLYLRAMNGTDKEAINIYGRSGEPVRYAPGYYAYPKDVPKMHEMIEWIHESCRVTPADVEARQIPHVVPIVGHRFLVVDRCASNPVLSMYGDDIILYASDLTSFLVHDIFHGGAREPGLPGGLRVPFWLE